MKLPAEGLRFGGRGRVEHRPHIIGHLALLGLEHLGEHIPRRADLAPLYLKPPQLEFPAELPPGSGRFLVTALETEDEFRSFFRDADGDEDGDVLDGTAHPHAENDAVDIYILDPLMGEITGAPLPHQFNEILIGIADLRAGDRPPKTV